MSTYPVLGSKTVRTIAVRSPLIAQMILCQIKSICIAQQAEKKLDQDLDNDTDQALRDFLVSFWLNPGNAAAYAYLGLLAPYLGLFRYPIIEIHRKIAGSSGIMVINYSNQRSRLIA